MSEQEKLQDELDFYKALCNRQAVELGKLTTELIKANMSNENLQHALQELVAAKEDE